MKTANNTLGAMIFLIAMAANIIAIPAAEAGDGVFGYRGGNESIDGWRLGPARGRDGYIIYRNTRHGWQQVSGSAIQIGGSSRNPWVVNSRNRIFYWNGRDWDRIPGSAIAIADGWAIGTNREHGGYGIYRWNGYRWDQAPGGAVAIGGSYDRPWVINNRNERFVWNGYDWDRSGRVGYREPVYSNSFGGHNRERFDDDARGYRSNDQRRRDPRRW